MDVYEPLYTNIIVLIGTIGSVYSVAFIANKFFQSKDETDVKLAAILQKINDTEDSRYENEKSQYDKIIESIIINKLYSSSIDSFRRERYNMHTICKYYDVKISIRYDKYYAFDICDGREYLQVSLMDYYKKNSQQFLTSLFNQFVTDIKLFIDVYNIDIDRMQHMYTVTHNRFTVKSHDYIPKISSIPFDNTVIDNDNVFIKLISKIVEDNGAKYFFIQKHTGRCELLYTNGIEDISLDTFDKENSVYNRYFYA
jgi:hypothetical protein